MNLQTDPFTFKKMEESSLALAKALQARETALGRLWPELERVTIAFLLDEYGDSAAPLSLMENDTLGGDHIMMVWQSFWQRCAGIQLLLEH